MLLNFKNETYQKLKYLAQKSGKSVASYVATMCDLHVENSVATNYTLKEEKQKDE